MVPSLPTATPPWHGPIADFPSGPRPQPGTVSNVIRPHPIRTGWGVSAASAGRASPKTRANAKEVERIFTGRSPGWVDGVAGSARAPGFPGRLAGFRTDHALGGWHTERLPVTSAEKKETPR